ncbi:MAG: glycoside hydrolase family 3 C-terminal domain-containing protein [Thermodesulfobacteriota bacterium]|nr:glycoside hydrolase family 3 C-terminal domain-containing protein [Thermodesulfobacteriota bacterium]
MKYLWLLPLSVISFTSLFAQKQNSRENLIEKKVEATLPQLTLEEKVLLTHGTNFFTMGDIKRLGIPELLFSGSSQGIRTLGYETAEENPQGVPPGFTTSFPSGIAMAASWDEELMERVGVAIGKESIAKGVHVLLGPSVNIMRTPLNGRNFEYSGEDPFLAGKIAAAFIRGVQSQNVGTSIKHLAGNNQETFRTTGNSEIGERTLREIYLPAFRMAVQEANAWTLMSAYNQVNGVYAASNKHLQQEIVKDEWGWDGVMMSDWGGTHSTFGSALGGLDLEMPGGKAEDDLFFGTPFLSALQRDDISETILDDKVRRILRLVYRTTLEEPKHLEANTKENQDVAKELAQKSIVLLKNDDILPLKKSELKSIAVIGPNSDKLHNSDGSWGSGGSGIAIPPYEITPLAGLKNFLGNSVKINYYEGYSFDEDKHIISPDNYYLDKSENSAHGVKAEYFNNVKSNNNPDVDTDGSFAFDWGEGTSNEIKDIRYFDGTPDLTLIQANIDFDWKDNPIDGIDKANYSVRWSSYLKAPATGIFDLSIVSSTKSRVYINNKLIIDNWNGVSVINRPGYFYFEKGKLYKIRVDAIHDKSKRQGYAKLSWRNPEEFEEQKKEAAQIAGESDVVLFYGGLNHQYDREAFGWGDVHADRPDLKMIGRQDELLEAVSHANPNTVVVLIGGGPIDVETWIEKVKAVVMAWYPGMEGGNAITDILFGNVNPSGKLPCTFGKKLDDWLCHSNGNFSDSKKDGLAFYDDGIWVGYRHFDNQNIEPRFPFGHGLSYTTFKYSNVKVPKQFIRGEVFKISVDITNTGSLIGEEVVQLYLGDEKSSVERPEKELKAFRKVMLNPGEKTTVELTLDEMALSFYDVNKKTWVAEPGEFKIYIGSSSRDIKLIKIFELK